MTCGSLMLPVQVWDSLYRAQQMDPFALVKDELESVSERLRRSIFTGLPTLRSAAEYFFKVRNTRAYSVCWFGWWGGGMLPCCFFDDQHLQRAVDFHNNVKYSFKGRPLAGAGYCSTQVHSSCRSFKRQLDMRKIMTPSSKHSCQYGGNNKCKSHLQPILA
jgi:hypothetical protein